MGRLSFLADEHVNRSYVTALRSNGYTVHGAGEGYAPGEDDATILSIAHEQELVLITNDDDFVTAAADIDHAGIIFYQQYGHTPKEFVRGITRVERYLTANEFRNHVEWLENWL